MSSNPFEGVRGYVDLHYLSEDARIATIGETVLMTGKVVAFCVDSIPPTKVKRYIKKLKSLFPSVEVLEQFAGPVEGVVTVKVRKKEGAS